MTLTRLQPESPEKCAWQVAEDLAESTDTNVTGVTSRNPPGPLQIASHLGHPTPPPLPADGPC